MGVIASVFLMLAGIFLPHNHNLSANAQTTVQADVTVAPSVTPTDNPTVTPTPSDVTVTPTVTVAPSVAPTVTPAPTATVSPTVTPTPAQQGDGDKDDMLGLKADVHALFGLMNAALHHEQNEQRFDTKHGVNRDQQ